VCVNRWGCVSIGAVSARTSIMAGSAGSDKGERHRTSTINTRLAATTETFKCMLSVPQSAQ